MGKILIDGVIYDLHRQRPAGICRVWQALLNELAKTEMAHRIVLLDRAGTAPRIKGIRRRLIKSYRFDRLEEEPLYLERICREENATLFLSTYYTYPENSPSVLMLHDMIPEARGMDLGAFQWIGKVKAIDRAFAYLSVSRSTRRDFRKWYPQYRHRSAYLLYNAVSDTFRPHASRRLEKFKKKYGLHKPYFLLSGNRLIYKNAMLFFRAFALLENPSDYEIVCTGGLPHLEQVFHPFLKETRHHIFYLDDAELSMAYGGAIALVYPSQHEGFGLPLVEAMKSGCPVITCRNTAIPEVAGDAALYVDEIDVDGMREALIEVQQPHVRSNLIVRGRDNASRFSWSQSGRRLFEYLIRLEQRRDRISLRPTDPIYTTDRLIHAAGECGDSAQFVRNMKKFQYFITGRVPCEHAEADACEQAIENMSDHLFDRLRKSYSRCGYQWEPFLNYYFAIALEGRGELTASLDAYARALSTHRWSPACRWRCMHRLARCAVRLSDAAVIWRSLAPLIGSDFFKLTRQSRKVVDPLAGNPQPHDLSDRIVGVDGSGVLKQTLNAIEQLRSILVDYHYRLPVVAENIDDMIDEALLLSRLERHDEAIALIDRVVEVRPGASSVLRAKGKIVFAAGNRQQGRQMLLQIIDALTGTQWLSGNDAIPDSFSGCSELEETISSLRVLDAMTTDTNKLQKQGDRRLNNPDDQPFNKTSIPR